MRYFKVLCAVLALMTALWALPVQAGPAPVVVIETSMGKVILMLDERNAPETVKNFLRYVDEGFYDGTIFHRVIDSADMAIVQGGGFAYPMKRKRTYMPIKNEAMNTQSNDAGTVAMARSSDPDSATCQFFFNVQDNPVFNYQGPSNPGYAVFGKVIRGMNVVKEIVKVKTGRKGLYDDVPREPVFIKKAYRMHG